MIQCELTQNNKVFVIGEIGVNHNGDVNIALEMIEKLAEAGADCAKFQTFSAEKLVTCNLETSPYQYKNMKNVKTQYDMLKSLELSKEEQILLKNRCESLGLIFMSSPFDIESINFLEEIGVKYLKVPSGEVTNLPYLIRVGKTKKTVIMSTGMSDMNEVEVAYDVLRKNGSKMIYLLHTTTAYPTNFSDVNLMAMVRLKEKFGENIGYSDHTRGVNIPIAAVALGARIIEKHVTLDKKMNGPDHAASIDFEEFKHMVLNIRNTYLSLGDGVKKPLSGEMENIFYARKSIVAKKHITKGEIFDENNITTKRPGGGISPMMWENVIGKFAKREYSENEMIMF